MSLISAIKKPILKLDAKYSKKIANSKANTEKFLNFKDFCSDKRRCFIIGNGPSLTKSDMDLLKNEITFVCNRFYHIYSEYESTAYFCQDPTVLKNEIENIKKAHTKFRLINPLIKIKNIFFKKNYSDDMIFYHIIRHRHLDSLDPLFSQSFNDGVYDGYTVTFSMIQMAVLFGFKEIYLLGIDFNYVLKDGKIDDSSYPKQLKGIKTGGLPDVEYNYKAFKVANEYATQHGIKIVNCSRTTKLDVFETNILENVLKGE